MAYTRLRQVGGEGGESVKKKKKINTLFKDDFNINNENVHYSKFIDLFG